MRVLVLLSCLIYLCLLLGATVVHTENDIPPLPLYVPTSQTRVGSWGQGRRGELLEPGQGRGDPRMTEVHTLPS